MSDLFIDGLDYGPNPADSWPVWTDPTGTTPQNGPGVQTNSLLSGSTQSAGQDKWSGWLQSLIGTGVNYAIAKDAKQNGLAQATAANGQPIYSPAGTASYVPTLQSNQGLLMIGIVALVGAVAFAASKG